MAIDESIYTCKICTGLKADKDYNRFLILVKRDGKRKRKVLDYAKKGWSKRDRVRIATRELDTLIDKLESVHKGDVPRLKGYVKTFFDSLPKTSWTTTKKKHYDNYIDASLGNKKIDEILPTHIEECMAKQSRDGLHPRTVNTTLEILRPLYKKAIINRLVLYSPCEGLKMKIPKSKKIVTDASERLREIHAVIMDAFRDDAFYRALYLFALMGRRKGEILSLRWENVSFDHSYVVLSDTKNDEVQKMFLPESVKSALESFYDPVGEWVFSSPTVPGSHINNIEKTTAKIKKKLPYFTLHYLRNVIVSAMAEQGQAAVSMSGALGHLSANTIDKYLTLNYLAGSRMASETIENIVK